MLTADRNRVRGPDPIFFVLAVAMSFLSLSLAAAAELGGKLEKSSFTVSYTQASGAFTPLWVAQDTGLFKKHGLDASLKMLNSQVALQALVAGEVDVISSGPDLVNARLQNVPVKYIGGSLQRFVFQLWGAKGIGTLAELKGKVIAVTTPRTSTEIATREAIKKTGVISEKDVSFLYVQTIPAILTAIMNGKTSAGTLSAPNTLKARDAGLSLLIDIAQTNVPGLHLAYGTTEKSIKSNPNLLYAFMKATAEATLLARQNPAVRLGIDGSTDLLRGTNQYNAGLSQRRVSTVRDALIQAGVSADRIETGTFAMQRGHCNDSTERCAQRDGRVEVLVRSSN